MTQYIDDHRASYGVEPICRLLEIAPSSYYAAKRRPPSARAIADVHLAGEVARIHADNLGVYGVRKTTAGSSPRRGVRRARPDLAPDAGPRARGGHPLPAHPHHHPGPGRRAAGRPRQPDLQRARSRPSLGRRPDLCLDDPGLLLHGLRHRRLQPDDRRLAGIELAPDRTRPRRARDGGLVPGGDLSGLVHHSDRGVQYCSIRYSERLDNAGIAASVGSKGDSFDNALAETVNGLYKAELIHRRERWRSVEEVELATADWVHFWNFRRLHSATDYLPPAEYERAYWRQQAEPIEAA